MERPHGLLLPFDNCICATVLTRCNRLEWDPLTTGSVGLDELIKSFAAAAPSRGAKAKNGP